VNDIAREYALAGNHDKVEEYRAEHQASVALIAKVYAEAGLLIPPFYRVISMLEKHDEVGENIIRSMCRLKNGEQNKWNPYWMNSGKKLELIIQAIEALKDTDKDEFIKNINNEKSDLYNALNIQRITPLTFFGTVGFNHAKTLIAVQDELADGHDYTAF
jgi:hypothetical protein